MENLRQSALVVLLIFIMTITSCLGMRKKRVGIVKEKFVTFSRNGHPKYFVVTDENSFQVSSEDYASLDSGEVYYENDFYLEH